MIFGYTVCSMSQINYHCKIYFKVENLTLYNVVSINLLFAVDVDQVPNIEKP